MGLILDSSLFNTDERVLGGPDEVIGISVITDGAGSRGVRADAAESTDQRMRFIDELLSALPV